MVFVQLLSHASAIHISSLNGLKSSTALPIPWCQVPYPRVQLCWVMLAVKVPPKRCHLELSPSTNMVGVVTGTKGHSASLASAPCLLEQREHSQQCVLTLSEMPTKPPGPLAHPARLPQCPQNVVRQLREVSVLVSPEVPGFRPLPFNHVLLVSGLRASCSTSRGSWLLPLTPWHPLPAPCPRAPGEQGVPAASMSQGIRTGPQLSPGVGGRARCPTSHTLAHTLPHPHSITAHPLCACDVCYCRQTCSTFTRFPTYPKELSKNTAISTATVTGLIGLARP